MPSSQKLSTIQNLHVSSSLHNMQTEMDLAIDNTETASPIFETGGAWWQTEIHRSVQSQRTKPEPVPPPKKLYQMTHYGRVVIGKCDVGLPDLTWPISTQKCWPDLYKIIMVMYFQQTYILELEFFTMCHRTNYTVLHYNDCVRLHTMEYAELLFNFWYKIVLIITLYLRFSVHNSCLLPKYSK